jgi:hypothetical protein
LALICGAYHGTVLDRGNTAGNSAALCCYLCWSRHASQGHHSNRTMKLGRSIGEATAGGSCGCGIVATVPSSTPVSGPSWFDRASTASPRPNAWTGQSRDQTVRPFSGQRHRRGKTSPQGIPGRPTGPRKDTDGQSECGSGHTRAPYGASLTDGPSL